MEPRHAIVFAFVASILGAINSWAGQSTHDVYLDCANGNDTADGNSPATAWRSVDVVSNRLFHPGDSLYFRRGTACTGMLAPKGSGSAEAPIHLDAWGTGTLPSIRAASGQQAALKLFNQEYWTIQHLDFSGGEPYGIFITGTKGILHGIHINDILVHDVTGQPKDKETGLLVIAAGALQAHFDDVVIDGVTAYGTSQWAGIMVAGVGHGFPPETSRNTNVTIRNSIAHDVAGDGIVLFQVSNGLIENCAAWHTGMQQTQTIGTPNAIWTWMCRNCVVRRNEAFLTDSPGVDGGAFDIDYGNDGNTVEENYGHDTQGYCVAVFGAGWATTKSVIRNNVCAQNGLSPRGARHQGAVFLTTWNGGKIDGLSVSGNRIFWNPPLAAAAVVNTAEFVGSAVFEGNTVESLSPVIIRSNASLKFDGNSYAYYGRGATSWDYDGKTFSGFRDYQKASRQDAHSREVREKGKVSAVPGTANVTVPGTEIPFCQQSHDWCLLGFVSDDRASDHASRGEIASLEGVHQQFPHLNLEFIVASRDANLRYDWNTGDIPILFDPGRLKKSLGIQKLPHTILIDPSGKIAWHHSGLTSPSELGLTLRSLVGNPRYAEMASKP